MERLTEYTYLRRDYGYYYDQAEDLLNRHSMAQIDSLMKEADRISDKHSLPHKHYRCLATNVAMTVDSNRVLDQLGFYAHYAGRCVSRIEKIHHIFTHFFESDTELFVKMFHHIITIGGDVAGSFLPDYYLEKLVALVKNEKE